MKLDLHEVDEAEVQDLAEPLREHELSMHMQVIQAAELRLDAARLHARLRRFDMQYDEMQGSPRTVRYLH